MYCHTVAAISDRQSIRVCTRIEQVSAQNILFINIPFYITNIMPMFVLVFQPKRLANKVRRYIAL